MRLGVAYHNQEFIKAIGNASGSLEKAVAEAKRKGVHEGKFPVYNMNPLITFVGRNTWITLTNRVGENKWVGFATNRLYGNGWCENVSVERRYMSFKCNSDYSEVEVSA